MECLTFKHLLLLFYEQMTIFLICVHETMTRKASRISAISFSLLQLCDPCTFQTRSLRWKLFESLSEAVGHAGCAQRRRRRALRAFSGSVCARFLWHPRAFETFSNATPAKSASFFLFFYRYLFHTYALQTLTPARQRPPRCLACPDRELRSPSSCAASRRS